MSNTNPKNSKQQVYVLMWLACALLVIGCQSKTGVGDASSLSSSSGEILECVGFNQQGISGKVRTYYNNNQQYSDQQVRLRFTTLHNDFFNPSNYIQIYRIKVSSSNVAYRDPNPVAFGVEDSQTKVQTLASQTYINQTQLSQAMGVSISASNLDKFNFLVQGSSFQEGYQKYQIVIYNSSNVPLEYSEVLIPAIAANPNMYEQTHSGLTTLVPLHPFWSQRASGWSDAQYKTMGDQYCF